MATRAISVCRKRAETLVRTHSGMTLRRAKRLIATLAVCDGDDGPEHARGSTVRRIELALAGNDSRMGSYDRPWFMGRIVARQSGCQRESNRSKKDR